MQRLDLETLAESRAFDRVEPGDTGPDGPEPRGPEGPQGPRGPYPNGLKRVFDLVAVLATAFVTVPLIGLLALAVCVEGGKPFYWQRRLGRGGTDFHMLKLRTMVTDADGRLARHLAENPDAATEWQRKQKLLRDPRVTRVGTFLRAVSLDELPQLWNVVIGEMSLVGPRPMMPHQRALYPGEAYFSLRPGITGLWQVTERHRSDFARRAAYDAAYAETVSFLGDIRILMRTVRVVADGRGC